MGTLTDIPFWLKLGILASPFWGTLLWTVWECAIRPRLIPRAEIERLAAAMVEHYGDRAEEVAFIEEDRAWRYSDGFEQGKWRRVRREIKDRACRW